MSGRTLLELVGAGFVFILGDKFGMARARALRSWRDFVATKSQMSGLFKRTIEQWRIAIKVGFVVGLLLAGVIVWAVTHV